MKKNTGKYVGRLLATALAVSALMAPPAQAAPTALAPHSVVAGKAIGEWTANWWQWAFSLSGPNANNPFYTDLQSAVDRGQSGPVFFLAGTANGPATRSFNVPADKYLLLPLLNVECSNLAPQDCVSQQQQTTEQELRDTVAWYMGNVAYLMSGGVTLPNPNHFDYQEAPAGTFSFDVAEGNAFGLEAGSATIAVADGYWLMLEPLGTTGPYTISYGGGYGFPDGSEFFTEVQATITGVPEPTSLALLAGGLAGLVGVRRRRA